MPPDRGGGVAESEVGIHDEDAGRGEEVFRPEGKEPGEDDQPGAQGSAGLGSGPSLVHPARSGPAEARTGQSTLS
jgi:hypothetical protein